MTEDEPTGLGVFATLDTLDWLTIATGKLREHVDSAATSGSVTFTPNGVK